MHNFRNQKPVRIIANEKTIAFSQKISKGIENALNFILDPDDNISIKPFEPFLMPIDAYIKAYKKKSILIKLHAEQAFSGELYWFFEMRTAIALGGQMRLIPGPAVEEKLQTELFDAKDQDSFGEVGNQLCGILDRIFREMTVKKIHLRMDFDKKVYPDESINNAHFVDIEEYVVLLGNIKLPKYGEQKLTLLLPRSLYETMLGIEIELEGISPKIVAFSSWDKDLCEELSKNLNTRQSKFIIANSEDEIFNLLETPGLCCVGMDLKAIEFPLTMKDSIFMKRIAANRHLQKHPLFLSYENSNEENIKALTNLGIKGATTLKAKTDFFAWALQNVTKDL